jgi:heat shock protein HtpX
MYNQIAANKRKTAFLILGFTIFICLLGYLISQLSDWGYGGLVLAIVISACMTLLSYYSGDKMALWSADAQPLQKTGNPYLYRLVENLCLTAGLPLPKIYLIPDQAINAFATGRDPQHSSLAVTAGALEKLTNEELEGVLAHELSHIKNYDIRLMTVVLVLVGTVSLLANWFWRLNWGGRGRSENDKQNPLLMVMGIILILLSPLIAELIKLAISRKREFLADANGALLTRYPQGLAAALQKIAADNQPLETASTATAHLYIANPFGQTPSLFVKLFSTHPPLAERIKALEQMAQAR